MEEPRQYGYDIFTSITVNKRTVMLNERHFEPFMISNVSWKNENQRKKALLFLTMLSKN